MAASGAAVIAVADVRKSYGDLNDGMLDVMVRGQGPEAALLPIGIPLGFAAAVLLIASRFFSWETD